MGGCERQHLEPNVAGNKGNSFSLKMHRVVHQPGLPWALECLGFTLVPSPGVVLGLNWTDGRSRQFICREVPCNQVLSSVRPGRERRSLHQMCLMLAGRRFLTVPSVTPAGSGVEIVGTTVYKTEVRQLRRRLGLSPLRTGFSLLGFSLPNQAGPQYRGRREPRLMDRSNRHLRC